MKTNTQNSTTVSSKWTHFLGAAILTGALIVPVVASVIQSPARVDLGTSGNFALLAKTGISVTGPSSIVGDLGVSPAAATYITGYDLIIDATNTFSTSSLVTGKIYAADYTDPTPTTMTTAISDMETAYTDAAGRPIPDFVELYTGDLTGQTLTPGLYKWSTGVLISAGGVTISGSTSDVWIFQIAGNLELASGANVTLISGAQDSNIFWQVAGQVTLGTTAAMKGILLCQTAIVMNTGATLNGRALAQTAVTLDANTVIRPATGTAVANGPVHQKSALFQNYLNKSIEFIVPSNGRTSLRILNTHGQEVAMLFNGDAIAGKRNQVQFDTSRLAKGLYFSKLEFSGNVILQKIVLVK